MKTVQVSNALIRKLRKAKFYEEERGDLSRLCTKIDGFLCEKMIEDPAMKDVGEFDCRSAWHLAIALELHDLVAECRRELLGQHQDTSGDAEVDGCFLTWKGTHTQEQWNRIESAKDRIIDFINGILNEDA